MLTVSLHYIQLANLVPLMFDRMLCSTGFHQVSNMSDLQVASAKFIFMGERRRKSIKGGGKPV